MAMLFIVVASVGGLAEGAELQLRDDVRARGPLVLLADIAEIHAKHSVEASELATIDLLPAPPAGEKRVLRAREIQDILVLRGVNLAKHRFSGASHVTIHGPRKETVVEAAKVSPAKKAASVAKQPIEDATIEAILRYLNEREGDQGWKVNLSLSEERAAAIAALGSQLEVSGGETPFTGKQRFLIAPENSAAAPIPVTARVELPPALVVARHSLPKGVLVQASDVTLQRGIPTKGEAEVYQSLEDVIGKETTRVITEGQILDSRCVRAQLLVKRGEIVTLYSRAAGVSVRTTARAREDGAMGDLVTVESLENRKPLFARVSGPQEVEVFAQAISAAEPTQHAARGR